MEQNRKESLTEKLTVSTFALFWKLTGIEKHLRDCTEDIIAFSRFLAGRLDFINKPEMHPWDFAVEWWDAISARDFELFADFGGIDECRDPEGMRRNIKERVMLDRINKMMPIFSEDLCGKEFAEVAEMCREDGVGRIESSPYWQAPLPDPLRNRLPPNFSEEMIRKCISELADEAGVDFIIELHPPFPPGDPVLVEEAKKCIKSNLGEANFAEHVPAPPDAEFGPHAEIC